MFVLIERYVNKLTSTDINNFAISNNINLSDEELDFTYNFVKRNYKSVLSNFNLFDFDKYKNYYSEENFIKIKKLIREYALKYSKYLK